jgi:hypothetical protein
MWSEQPKEAGRRSRVPDAHRAAECATNLIAIF